MKEIRLVEKLDRRGNWVKIEAEFDRVSIRELPAPAAHKVKTTEAVQLPLRVGDEDWAETEAQIYRDLQRKIDQEMMENLEADQPQMIERIMNPATRTYTHAKNSDGEIVRIESVGHLPETMPDSSWDHSGEPEPILVDPRKPVDVVEYPDKSQRNPDIPKIQSFADMGLIDPIEPPKFQMDRAHFSEMCVTNGRVLMALYLKGPKDFEKPYWKSEAWIMENLSGCSYKEANRFSRTIEKIGLRREDVHKIMDGYYSVETNRYRLGLKDRKTWRKELGKYNAIARKLQELKRNEMHSGETNADPEEAREVVFTGASEYSLANALPTDNVLRMKELMMALESDDEVEAPDERTEDERFEKPSDSAFGARRLWHGDEAVSHELLTYIRTGDSSQVYEVIKAMFPQENAYGYKVKAKYSHLTPSQKSQVWRYIKDRQAELQKDMEIDL